MTRTKRAEYIRQYREDVEVYVNEGDAENAKIAATLLGHVGRAALKARASRERARAITAAYQSVGMIRTAYGWE